MRPEEPEEEHERPGSTWRARSPAGWPARPRRPARPSPARPAPQAAATPRAVGAHPDDRDPQTIDVTLGRFVSEQGWETELRVHGVFSRWDAIVGREVAQHVTPESYADGRLVVRTDSTAWAVEMKNLAPTVVRRLNEVLGDETVPRDRRRRTPGAVVEARAGCGSRAGARATPTAEAAAAGAVRRRRPERPRGRMGSRTHPLQRAVRAGSGPLRGNFGAGSPQNLGSTRDCGALTGRLSTGRRPTREAAIVLHRTVPSSRSSSAWAHSRRGTFVADETTDAVSAPSEEQPEEQPTDQSGIPGPAPRSGRGPGQHPRGPRGRGRQLRRQRDPGPRGPRGGPQASRHVHRLHR